MQVTKPIGVFDSGVGGLTVLKALIEACPNEDFIYLGDTARLPYGTKSRDTVIQYAVNGAQMMMEQDVKCFIVACNTASSVAIPALIQACGHIPVLGVIEPGAQACHARIKQGKVLVLATEGTTRWHAYQQALERLNSTLEVIEWPCPLFVALAEEGWTQGVLVKEIVQEVLKPQLSENLAGVLLGCTHFPLLLPVFKEIFHDIPIIDSAMATAQALKNCLSIHQLHNPSTTPGTLKFLATDGLERFAKMARRFMAIDLPHCEVALVSSQSMVQGTHKFLSEG